MQRPSRCPVTTPFGKVAGYPLNGGFHMGVDFAYIPDSKIYMPEDGVVHLNPNDGSLGHSIHIYVAARHHALGHTSQYLVPDGSFQKRGTPIAIMGSSGAADGIHLHWALAINGTLVDPLTQVNEEFIMSADAVTTSELTELHQAILFGNPGPLYVNAFTGKPLQTIITDFRASNNPIRAKVEKQYQDGARVPALEKQIADKDKLLLEIKAKADLSDSLQKKVDEMTAERTKDTETGNSFIRWIGGLFNKQ